MKIVRLFALTNVLLLVFSKLIIKEEKENAIGKCVVTLISQDKVKDRTIIYVSEYSNDVHYLASLSNPLIITTNNNPNYVVYGITSDYVIYTQDHNSLRRTLNQLKTNYRWEDSNGFNAKFIIMIAERENMQYAFKALCDDDIKNAVLLNQHLGVVTLYRSLTCMKGISKTSEIEIRSSTCGTNLTFEKTLFDYSLANLHGRKIILMLHTNRAFPTLVDPYSNPPALLKHYLTLLAERSNASIEYKITKWKGNDFLDTSGDDVVITYYLARSTEDSEVYDLSEMLYLDTMVWIVPKALQLPAVEVIGQIFDLTIWITIAAVYLVITILWFIFDKIIRIEDHGSFVRCALMAFALIVANASAVLPKGNSLRVLLIAYFMYTMNISTIFQTMLNAMLLNPGREPKITTIKEMLETRLQPLITKLAARQINDSDSILTLNLLKKSKISMLNVTGNLHLVAYARNSSTHIGEQIMTTYKTEKKMVDVIESSCGIPNIELGFAIRTGHPLLFLLNKFIKHYLENGFLKKWHLDFYKIDYLSMEEEESKSVITMEHIKTMLILWLIGICVAFITFLIEVFYARKRSFRKNRNFVVVF